MERYPQKVQAAEEKALLDQEARFPPACLIYKSESGCTYGEKCRFPHVKADVQPSTKSKKSGVKGSVAILKESFQLGCVSQDSHPRKLIPRKEGKFGSNPAVKFSKGTWHQIKIRERKGPSRGIIQKFEPHERSPCAPKFEERSQEETLHQESCARREALDLATIFASSRMRRKLRFTLQLKPGQRRRPLRNDQRNENSWLILEHECSC